MKAFFRYSLKLDFNNVQFSFFKRQKLKPVLYISRFFSINKIFLTPTLKLSKSKFRYYILFYYIHSFLNKNKYNKLNFWIQKLIKILFQNFIDFSYFFSQKKLNIKQIIAVLKNISKIQN